MVRYTVYTRIGTECYKTQAFRFFSERFKARLLITKSLAMEDKCGVRKIELSCYQKLGEVSEFLGEYVKAQEYYLKALAIAEENGDRKAEAAYYERLGKLFQILGEYSKAKEYKEKALAIAEKKWRQRNTSSMPWIPRKGISVSW